MTKNHGLNGSLLSETAPEKAHAIGRAVTFLQRQPHNFRVIVGRMAFSSFLMGLTSPYESIYVVALGASSTELGLVNGIGNAASALIAAPAGWLVNRFGVRRYFLSGIALSALATLIFAVAPAWGWIAGAMLLANIGLRLSGTACGVTCAASLQNTERGTGMGLCNTLYSAAGMVAPLLAAVLVTGFGGVNVAGLRPLYLVRFVGTLLMLGMMARLLQDLPNLGGSSSRPRFSLRKDMAELFTGRAPLKRWIVISFLGWLPTAMAGPFVLLYAHEIKGADAYVLGLMGSAISGSGLVMSVPLGHLADRIGRKKVLYLLAPANYLCWGLLVLAPGSVALVVAGAMWGISQLGLVIAEAMSNELVPLPQMGRWQGLLALFRGLVSVPAPLISGLLWDQLGPASIFVVPAVLDLCLRLPLLSTMPETLHRPACESMT